MKTTVNSDYYEKAITMDHTDAIIILNIYKKIAVKQKFQPEVDDIFQMLEDTSALDHVLYHVENFGTNYPRYENIKHYFET